MPASIKDPRTYVQSAPLPFPKQNGVKIQARSAEFYNPTFPSRDYVRDLNYKRRVNQMSHQGFRSVNYKPYKGIGDPFYLDQKKLILHALGQLEEGQDLDSSSDSESSGEEEMGQQTTGQTYSATANFMLRKARKGLNTLGKEMQHGRDMVRNVRLGHGLFQLMQRENERRTEAKQRELQKKREQMWNEWQPPKSGSDSDSDDTDDDLRQEVDLKHYMVASSVFGPEDKPEETQTVTTTFLTQGLETKTGQESRSVVFRDVQNSTHSLHPTDFAKSIASNQATDKAKSIVSINPSSGRSSKKKIPSSRPFTPQHSNINTDYNVIPDKQALFRQLCTLYWLLEAMNANEQTQMSPITTCWNLKEIGGSKTHIVAKVQKEKVDQKWKQFTTKADLYKPTYKRHSGARASLRPTRRGSAFHRGSASSTPNGSQSQLNLSGSGSVQGTPGVNAGPSTARRFDHIPEDSESGTVMIVEREEEEGKDKNETNAIRSDTQDGEKQNPAQSEEPPSTLQEGVGIRTDGSGAGMGLRRRGTMNEEALHMRRGRSGSSPKRASNTGEMTKELQLQILESINRSEEDPRLHRLANPTEKRSSSGFRAEYNIRPKSSPAVLDYQASLPSTRIGTLPNKLRREFDEVTEEKALVLHDTLDAIDRDRMRKLRTMFVQVPARTSLHKALDRMRTRAPSEEDQKDKRRRSSTHQQWYIDIFNAVPDDMKEDWYCDKILDKLSKYGLVEASKQSAYKFLRVLAGLRDWEICSPDICAAIEFCREKIVEMTIEEYEEWFIQTFPNITRPQTAPPAMKGSKREAQKAIEGRSDKAPNSASAGNGTIMY